MNRLRKKRRMAHTINAVFLDRADEVAKTLSGKYGIASTRLKSYGVASLSPVTSNDTEDGKAKNRRVELVKQ